MKSGTGNTVPAAARDDSGNWAGSGEARTALSHGPSQQGGSMDIGKSVKWPHITGRDSRLNQGVCHSTAAKLQCIGSAPLRRAQERPCLQQTILIFGRLAAAIPGTAPQLQRNPGSSKAAVLSIIGSGARHLLVLSAACVSRGCDVPAMHVDATVLQVNNNAFWHCHSVLVCASQLLETDGNWCKRKREVSCGHLCQGCLFMH